MTVSRFSNVEALLIDYLSGKGVVNVSGSIPADRPDSFVTVERYGGARRSMVVDEAVVCVQCWAKTRHQASELAYAVDALLADLPDARRDVLRVDRTGMTNFPDESGHPRYQLLLSIETTV